MFGFIKKVFFVATSFFSGNILSATPLKYISMNNQECKVRLEIININSNEPVFFSISINDTHREKKLVLLLNSVQKSIEMQGWLLLMFFICLHNQLSSFNSFIVQMTEKRDSSNKQ